MIYLVIWNNSKYHQEEIHAKTWIEFIDELTRITLHFGFPPDLIYLKESRMSKGI